MKTQTRSDMQPNRSTAVALICGVLTACAAGPPPVEETTVDLPPPVVASARSSSEFTATLPSVAPHPSSNLSAPATSEAPRLPFPIPSSQSSLPPAAFPLAVFPPGLFPAGPGGAAANPTTTAQPLSKQAAARLAKDLRQVLATEAPGTVPVSPEVGGRFQAVTAATPNGDLLVAGVLVEPNKCYSFAAVTRDTVEISLELQMNFQGGLPLPMPPLAATKAAGPSVVLGGGNKCFKLPMPLAIPMNLIARTSGPAEVLVGAVAK